MRTLLIVALVGSNIAATIAKQDSVVDIARDQLGTVYHYGARFPAQGFDCSGLVQFVYDKMHYALPRTVREQVKVGVRVTGPMQPGDLIFFGSPIRHVGIYVRDGTYVRASSVRGRVIEGPLYRMKITEVRRIISP